MSHQSPTESSKTDLDIYFPPFNNGSHCSYYTEALSLASPLFCNRIPASPLSRPLCRAQHLLTNQLEWLTHHILGHTQLGCVCRCLCISRLPLRILREICGNVDFYICVWVCVSQISVVCFFCGLGGLTTQTEQWERIHRWPQEWTARPRQSAEQERQSCTCTYTHARPRVKIRKENWVRGEKKEESER